MEFYGFGLSHVIFVICVSTHPIAIHHTMVQGYQNLLILQKRLNLNYQALKISRFVLFNISLPPLEALICATCSGVSINLLPLGSANA
ncbi:Protein of unknown function [Cotesia congregata]|uniref:Uncharacterized protein n=1 Tax=Cotesia congregata TaxID=51543 RepID=A0A8J2H5X0_COTCN|nr:Protein of unknown function [Cotesia congregata]